MYFLKEKILHINFSLPFVAWDEGIVWWFSNWDCIAKTLYTRPIVILKYVHSSGKYLLSSENWYNYVNKILWVSQHGILSFHSTDDSFNIKKYLIHPHSIMRWDEIQSSFYVLSPTYLIIVLLGSFHYVGPSVASV